MVASRLWNCFKVRSYVYIVKVSIQSLMFIILIYTLHKVLHYYVFFGVLYILNWCFCSNRFCVPNCLHVLFFFFLQSWSFVQHLCYRSEMHLVWLDYISCVPDSWKWVLLTSECSLKVTPKCVLKALNNFTLKWKRSASYGLWFFCGTTPKNLLPSVLGGSGNYVDVSSPRNQKFNSFDLVVNIELQCVCVNCDNLGSRCWGRVEGWKGVRYLLIKALLAGAFCARQLIFIKMLLVVK